jgi:hypothetical protein
MKKKTGLPSMRSQLVTDAQSVKTFRLFQKETRADQSLVSQAAEESLEQD